MSYFSLLVFGTLAKSYDPVRDYSSLNDRETNEKEPLNPQRLSRLLTLKQPDLTLAFLLFPVFLKEAVRNADGKASSTEPFVFQTEITGRDKDHVRT